jgi:hypothetical protein
MTNQKTLYSELRPFADMMIDQGRGVTVSDLTFASAEDRYSTAFIPLVSSSASSPTVGVAAANTTLPAGQTVKFMQKNIGEAGQGFTASLTVGETNNTNGDRQPSNQVYIATHLGFKIYGTLNAGSLNEIQIQSQGAMGQIAGNTTWALTVGDGIKRTLGTILEYPAGSGVTGFVAVGGPTVAGAALISSWANNGSADCEQKRKLPIPIVFPPNIQVDLEIKTGAAQTFQNNASTTASVFGGAPYGGIAFKATFKGFRMTMPA